MKERFVKVGNDVYYESALVKMSDEQLREIISRCQDGINQINIKKDDYELINKCNTDDPHYIEVMRTFNQASCYLQSDIVLIDRILKSRREQPSEIEWYKCFVKNTFNCILRSRFRSIVDATNEQCGFSVRLNVEI